MLGVSSLAVLGIVVAGWASNSHYPLIGALRSSAQMVSYEVAMGLAVVSAVLMTSMNASGNGHAEHDRDCAGAAAAGHLVHFQVFPLGFIAFAIFAIAMVAETNRAPFDMAEAESELTAGYHTEYSGLRWSLFHAGGICRDDCGLFDRGHAVARRMDASVSEPAAGTGVGVHLLLFPD